MAPRRLALALPLLLGLVASSGCDVTEDDPRTLDVDGLSERFACEDLSVVAATADGSEALMVGIDDGLAASALASGEPVVAAYDLPDDRLTVRWVAGTNVYQGHCGRDTGEDWHIDARMDALAGRIVVRVEPDVANGGSLRVTAELLDLILDSSAEALAAERTVTETVLVDLPID